MASAAKTQSSAFIDWINTTQRTRMVVTFCALNSLASTHILKKGVWKSERRYVYWSDTHCNAKQAEHFYLRTLLTIKQGARSFRYLNLCTMNGVYYQGSSAACQAMGLIFDYSEWFSLFNKVKNTSSASALRQTFAAALHLSALINPQSLWDRFKAAFIDDCLWWIRNLEDSLISPPIVWTENHCLYYYGLWLLEEKLKDLSLDWDTAWLVGPENSWVVRESNSLLVETFDFDQSAEATKHTSALSILFSG